MRKRRARRSKKIVEAEGVAHIKATFNNTLITITDKAGNTVVWGSAGKGRFQGLQEVDALCRYRSGGAMWP